MTIRFIDEEGKHRIIDVREIELEGATNATVKNGIWVFKEVTQ